MDYNSKFKALLQELKLEESYWTFIELERIVGSVPKAEWYKPEGGTKEVTVWCSNDYLGTGHNPDVLAAMHQAIAHEGAGTGGTHNISGTNHHIAFESIYSMDGDVAPIEAFCDLAVANAE